MASLPEQGKHRRPQEFQIDDEPEYCLTKSKLEDHDKIWKDRFPETMRESASDTEAEFTLMETRGNRRQHFSKHMPNSSSRPLRYNTDDARKNHRRSLSFSPKRLQYPGRSDFDTNMAFRQDKKTFSSSLERIPQLDFDSDSETLDGGLDSRANFPDKIMPKYKREEHNTMDQSRYSVTDYFNRYPAQNGKEVKKYPQEMSKLRNNYNPNLFKESEVDVSASVIDDDKFSSVSGKTFSTVSTATTVDNQAFKKGIETLDANIARLQSDLHKRRQLLA